MQKKSFKLFISPKKKVLTQVFFKIFFSFLFSITLMPLFINMPKLKHDCSSTSNSTYSSKEKISSSPAWIKLWDHSRITPGVLRSPSVVTG